ncbi:hypothetical protein B9Z55_015681 [Caenorhabditis nigoni]|uniref:Uncharacterized protein n=1 Tax=Caenorhabditis nigoni TaxID=1611254 RepID=A0A2G5UBA8_9PELO|nr:hypothetical protein B9Z55_015681 [Caenorhabditis nigoni]
MDDDLNKDLESVWAQFLKKRDLIHLVHLEDADRSNWSDELQDKLEELNRFNKVRMEKYQNNIKREPSFLLKDY